MLEDPVFMERVGWQYLLRDDLKELTADAVESWGGWWAFEWMLTWIEVLRDRHFDEHPDEEKAWEEWDAKNRRPGNGESGGYTRRDIPVSLRREIMERDAYRCQECQTWKDLTIDHIKPVSKGGTNRPNNLRVLCQPCNSRKGNRL